MPCLDLYPIEIKAKDKHPVHSTHSGKKTPWKQNEWSLVG